MLNRRKRNAARNQSEVVGRDCIQAVNAFAPISPHTETPVRWVETYQVPKSHSRNGMRNVE